MTEEKPKHAGGRPKKYTDEKKLQEDIDAYFESCFIEYEHPKTHNIVRQQVRPFTLSGLAYDLGMDRGTILNYSKDEKFFSTIKRAKDRCEAYAEESLFHKDSVAGGIFNLTNNYNKKDAPWTNKQEVVNDIKIAPQIVDDVK